ncbi:MAG: hypothetical protein H0U60_11495 [Blastocatellia bacterium]|nr:hypothetical protein [Blastocatellia bacterium]
MPVYRRKDTKSRRWYYKFDINGETYKRNIPTARTQRQAEEAERRARDDVHAGIYGSQKDMLFTKFVEKYYKPWAEQHHKNQVNDKTIQDLLCKHFKGLMLSKVSRFSVETFKLTLAKSQTRYGNIYKPNTINLALAYLSIIMNLALEYKKVRENPVKRVKRLPVEEGRPRYLLPEEEAILVPACYQEASYLGALVQLAVWTGLSQE